jgi:hypothetical protein
MYLSKDKQQMAFKDLVEQVGVAQAPTVIRTLLEEKKIRPEDCSFKEIFEAVGTGAFPQITAELISAKVIEGYTATATIGDSLVTTYPASFEDEKITGFGAVEQPDQVLEGATYTYTEIGEKYVQIKSTKYGKLIAVTEEMIQFDRTGQILMRAKAIGEKAALHREKAIVQKVIDVNSDAIRFNGAVGQALYRSTAVGNLKINLATGAPFGEAGLEAILKLMHNMTDDNGDFVYIDPNAMMLLVPQDLMVEALQMNQSTLVPEGSENAVNTFKGAYTPLTSPYITEQSTTSWYLGDFKRDIFWTEIWPLQTFTHVAGNEDEFKRDIKAQYKVRYFGGCGAVDDKHVYKATA